jgi:hypothetical protein
MLCGVCIYHSVPCLLSAVLLCEGCCLLHRARINNAFFLITGPLLSILLSSISSAHIPNNGVWQRDRANVVRRGKRNQFMGLGDVSNV